MERKIAFKIAVVFIVFLFSCSKDKDETLPTIVIHAPVHLQQINGIDTVQVLATITDDRNLESVSVSLRNDNDIPVLGTISKKPNSRDYELNVSYFFDDVHLPSGQYYFAINASDGENTNTKYVSIFLNETPRVRKGIFVISNGGNYSDIYYLDNGYNGSPYNSSINGDYLGAAVNSHDQQLIHASGVSGSISSIDLNSGSNIWNIPIINSPPTPFYIGFLYSNRSIFLGKRNGGIQGYNRYGVANFNAITIPNFSVKYALVHDNILVTEQHTLSSNLVKLIPYWMASGNPTGTNAALNPNEDIVGMFTRTANEIIVITNDVSSNGNLILYNPNTGSINSFPIGLGQIDDCIEIDVGVYLVVHSGTISTINVNNNFPFSTTTFLSGTGANNIWYDDLTNELFVANGSLLSIYDYASISTSTPPIDTYIHTDVIKDVVFWYNK